MKKICLIFLMFLFFIQLFADDEKLKLAVMDLEDLSGKISKNTLAEASEYFRVIFAQTNRYIIISKERQKEQIGDLRKKYNTDPSYKSCNDKNCQIQLGQALSADLIVKTSVSFFAGSYTLASELIDLEKEATVMAATEEYNGSPKELRNAIKKIVKKIVNNGKYDEEEEKQQSQPSQPQPQQKQEIQAVHSSKILDSKVCAQARENSNVESWEEYLKLFSAEGICVEEAKTNIANLKNKLSNWSNKAPKKMNFDSAQKYCADLIEDGHEDWRLPNISELRTLALNCTKIGSDGKCPITKDWRDILSLSADKCLCEPGAHSILGDSDPIWSDTSVGVTFGMVRFVFLSAEGIGKKEKKSLIGVRCIRDEKKK